MREMKDSGIDWIGTIPQDWQLSKIGSLYTQRNEKVSDKDYQPLSVTMQGILPQLATAAKTNDGGNRKLVRVGDFAINSRSDRRGSCGISPLDGSVSLINIILTPRTAMHPGYYNWLFHTTLFADEFYKWGHGIVADLWTTRWQEMKSITVPVPEYAEQERIAAFLDAECAEIDAVLEKTRASIEEYKKLKQAVITQAVTKGIRGDRPMKDSGSVWFEEIPCNWVMKRIKYLFHIKKDIAGKEGYTVLSITQRGIQPKDLSKNEGQIAANYSQYQLLAPGDFAMNHMDLLTGWVDISKYSGVTSPDYRVFVLDDTEKNDSSYYLYLMQMCYFNRIFYGLGQGVSGMGRWRLQADKFMNFPVVVPIVRRLLELRKIDQSEYETYADLFRREIEEDREKRKIQRENGIKSSIPRNMSREAIDRTSPSVSKILYQGYVNDVYSKLDIARHLNVGQNHIDKFLREVSKWNR